MRKTTFSILCVEAGVLSFSVAASAALIPSIANDFAVEQFVAARIIWLYMLSYGVAALFYGPLIRTFNAKKVELIFFALFVIANFAAAVSRSMLWLSSARFMMGAFGASVIPLGLIIIAKRCPQQERGKKVGVFFGWAFLASLAGLFLSGVLPWRMIYLIPALAGLALWAVMFLFLPDFKAEQDGLSINYLRAFKDQKVLTIFSYIFFISLFYHGVQQWLAVYFSIQLSYTQFLISMLISLTGLAGALGEFIGGALADSIGRRKTVNLGIILMLISVLPLIIKIPFAWVIGLAMALWGLGWTFNHAGISTMITDLPKEFLNEAASLNSGLRFLSGGLGVWLAGLLMRKSFVLGFSTFACGLVLLLIIGNRVIKREGIA